MNKRYFILSFFLIALLSFFVEIAYLSSKAREFSKENIASYVKATTFASYAFFNDEAKERFVIYATHVATEDPALSYNSKGSFVYNDQ